LSAMVSVPPFLTWADPVAVLVLPPPHAARSNSDPSTGANFLNITPLRTGTIRRVAARALRPSGQDRLLVTPSAHQLHVHRSQLLDPAARCLEGLASVGLRDHPLTGSEEPHVNHVLHPFRQFVE